MEKIISRRAALKRAASGIAIAGATALPAAALASPDTPDAALIALEAELQAALARLKAASDARGAADERWFAERAAMIPDEFAEIRDGRRRARRPWDDLTLDLFDRYPLDTLRAGIAAVSHEWPDDGTLLLWRAYLEAKPIYDAAPEWLKAVAAAHNEAHCAVLDIEDRIDATPAHTMRGLAVKLRVARRNSEDDCPDIVRDMIESALVDVEQAIGGAA